MKAIIAALGLSIGTAAFAAPTITFEGECPGVVTATVTLDAAGSFRVLRGIIASETLQGGGCQFTEVDVAGVVSRRLVTGSTATHSWDLSLTDDQCGNSVQVIDMDSCDTSGVGVLPGGGGTDPSAACADGELYDPANAACVDPVTDPTAACTAGQVYDAINGCYTPEACATGESFCSPDSTEWDGTVCVSTVAEAAEDLNCFQSSFCLNADYFWETGRPLAESSTATEEECTGEGAASASIDAWYEGYDVALSSTFSAMSEMICGAPADVDCEGTWSTCTNACESGGERVFIVDVPQSGLGALCPTMGPDCLPGEGECAPDICAGGPLTAPIPDCAPEMLPSTGDWDQDCVDRINQFRWECQCLPPLDRWEDAEVCTDFQAEQDQAAFVSTGFPHTYFGMCGEYAQNSCDTWSPEQALDTCMQMMWDEGPEPFLNHYAIMSADWLFEVSCGYSETASGVWANQNFR